MARASTNTGNKGSYSSGSAMNLATRIAAPPLSRGGASPVNMCM